jgi:hypothetical protein
MMADDDEPILRVLASIAMGGDDELDDMGANTNGLVEFGSMMDWGIDLGMDSGVGLPGLGLDTEARSRTSSTTIGQFSSNMFPPPPPPLAPPSSGAGQSAPASPRFSLSILPNHLSSLAAESVPPVRLHVGGGVAAAVAGASEAAVARSSSSKSSPSSNSSTNKPKSKSSAKKKNLKRKRATSSSTSAEEEGSDDGKVDIRLQRNRESAKQYRIRKKAEISMLESSLAHLEEQNEAFRKQIALAQAQRQMVNVQNNEEFESRMDKLIELVDKNASDEDILQQLYRLRIDYHARSARLNYHLEKIQKLMQPLPIEEVCVSCSYGSTNPASHALIRLLRKTLGVNDETTKQILRYRAKTLELHERRKRTQQLCVAAGSIAIEELKQMDEFFVNLPNTLYTPRQAARFMRFIHENKALGIVINSNIEKLIPRPNDLPTMIPKASAK